MAESFIRAGTKRAEYGGILPGAAAVESTVLLLEETIEVRLGNGRSLLVAPSFDASHSVVESCRRLKIPVREYLAAILPGLSDVPIPRLPQLTPASWKTQHK